MRIEGRKDGYGAKRKYCLACVEMNDPPLEQTAHKWIDLVSSASDRLRMKSISSSIKLVLFSQSA